MAMYSAKEMKSKIGNGKSKVREMEIKDNKTMKLWIPKDEFIHLVKHFNIQTVDKFKHARSKAVTCINSDVDEEKQVCPVCDYISSLWKQWRNTVDKDEKTVLQNKINRLMADFYYVNAVNVTGKDKAEIKELLKNNDYSDLKCESLRITPPIFKQICAVISPDDDDGIEISSVLWSYKKAVTGQTRYTINEETNDPIALLLSKRIDQICNRPEKDGGYIDLDKGYNEHQEQKEYIAKLYGDEDEDYETDVLDDEDDEEPKKPSKPAKTAKKPVKKEPEVVEDDEDVSLDELDEEPAKPVKKTAPKKPAVKDDDLEDDELESGKAIEDIDPDEAPAPKKVAPAKAAKKPAKDEDDDLDDLEDEEPAPKAVKKTATKKPAVEDDDDSLDDLDEEPKKPSKPVKTAKKPVADDDDLEIDVDFDDEDI